MKFWKSKNWALALMLACFFYNGQQICLQPQAGGGVDTGNPKGEPTNDPTKPYEYIEYKLEDLRNQLPGMQKMGRGPHELGPKIIKRA